MWKWNYVEGIIEKSKNSSKWIRCIREHDSKNNLVDEDCNSVYTDIVQIFGKEKIGMQIRNTKFFCAILALFIFLSRLFVEKTPNHFDAHYPLLESTDIYVESTYATISDTQICTTDMLGGIDVYGLQKMLKRFISSKRGLIVSINFLFLHIFLLQAAHFCGRHNGSNLSISCMNEPVIHYIHSSDGKKRI